MILLALFPSGAAGQTSTDPTQLREPIETDPQADLLEWAVGGAQILAVLAAGVAAYWVYRQIKDAREAREIERSLAYLQRYADRDQRQRFSVVTSYLNVSSASQCVAHIQAWETAPHAEAECLPRARVEPTAPSARKNDVSQILDFFEELGGAFNRGHLDDKVILSTIAPIPARFLAQAWWFIVWRRKGESLPATRLYAELENMVRNLRNGERPDFRNYRPKQEIRVLAVLDRDASAEDWERCGRLAEAVSNELAREEPRLLQQIPATPVERSVVSASGITLIAVPVDLDDGQHAKRKQLVAEVQARLTARTPNEIEAVIRALGGQGPKRQADGKQTAREVLRALRSRLTRILESVP